MKRTHTPGQKVLGISLALAGAIICGLPCQAQAPMDPFDVEVSRIELNNESVMNGVAKLSQQSTIRYSVEWILNEKAGQQPGPDPKHSAALEHKSLKETLDWLFSLDRRYTWVRVGTTVNVFPAALKDSAAYFPNRILPTLVFSDVTDAGAAILVTLRQLPGKHEQIAFVQAGGSDAFEKPWTETFHDVTVRQAFDKIAEHLGQTVGWQLMGSRDFRMIMFHRRLVPHSTIEDQHKTK
jgi:hypothetical protein